MNLYRYSIPIAIWLLWAIYAILTLFFPVHPILLAVAFVFAILATIFSVQHANELKEEDQEQVTRESLEEMKQEIISTVEFYGKNIEGRIQALHKYVQEHAIAPSTWEPPPSAKIIDVASTTPKKKESSGIYVGDAFE